MKKIISWILTIALCLIMILPSYIYATGNINTNGDINTNAYKDIYNKTGNTKLISAGGSVLAVVQKIGISCGIILLIILGVKYMIMSSNAESKATIKEKLIPYAIGAVLLFGGTGILSIIAKFAQNMVKQ